MSENLSNGYTFRSINPAHAWPKFIRPRLITERFWRSQRGALFQLLPIEEENDGARVSLIGAIETEPSVEALISSPSRLGMNQWQSR